MRKYLVLTVLLTTVTFASHALTVEDYCDVKVAKAPGPKAITPMPGGETYAQANGEGTMIDLFSYKTGKKVGNLFDVSNIKGEVKISQFDGFEVSENGKKVLLWNDSEGIYRYSFTAEYFVFDTTRQIIKRVSKDGPQRCATISDDGRMVAYVRDNNIYVSNLDYDTDRPITSDGEINKIINGAPDWSYEEEFSMLSTLRWSKDGNYLVYLRFDESEVPEYSFDDYRGYCNSDPLSDPYPSEYSYKYPLPGYPVSKVQVYAYDMNNRTAKKLDIPIADGDYVPALEFDGRGENVMVMTLNHDQNVLHLYRVNPGSTVAHDIMTEKSEAWLSPMAYQMVAYYDDCFIIASERSGYRHLYQYNYDGVLQKQITDGDFNVTAFYGFDVKKNNYYLQTTYLGAINRSVTAVDAKGKLKLLTGEEGCESARWNKDFTYWVRDWSDAVTPPVYSIMDADGKTVSVIEDNSAYKEKYASAPKMELLTVKNAAGEEMNAYMIKPTGFDSSKKYPVLMYQYNGPDSQEVLNTWRMEGIFYLASEGYIICAVDGRGTNNRSRKWAYSVYKDLGNIEVQDQIAGAEYFASLPYADSSRIACFGWSYGGYMTLMELQRQGNPFKCGVAMAAVTDWRFYDAIYTERFMLTPGQNEKGYDNSSALKDTERMNVPLLIMSGTNDDNVHFYNTLKYTSKLNFEGKLFDMMAYAGFEHSLRMCNARVQLFRKISQFLKMNL